MSIDLPLQDTSLEIWRKKYKLENEETVLDTMKRVSTSLAQGCEETAEKFLWAMKNGAIPAGRILANAGAEKFKPKTSTINCTVSRSIPDSMEGIMDSLKEAALTLKSGAGIGYDFSTLRPKGAYVSGAGAYTSGSLSFMDIFDRMCFTVSSAGGRRGAQMGCLDVRHPDILDFIKAKREDGRLRQFNVSVLITNEFMEAVKNDQDWNLIFPVNNDKDFNAEIVYAKWPIPEGAEDHFYWKGEEVACKVYNTVKARKIWDLIMKSTYDYAEPGFLLIDQANSMNNNYFCEEFRATNPCGEQFLPPHGGCLLGSINLTHFVENPCTYDSFFDWEKYRKVIEIFTEMLDNVVEINGLPLEKQREEIERKRRHGMGFLGLGSTLALLGIKYGSEEAVQFTEDVSFNLAVSGYYKGAELAMEKGPAPIMYETFDDQMLDAQGWELWMSSDYMQNLFELEPYLKYKLEKSKGCRFTHHSSIAPTGTISLSLGNNASNGIEPSFSHKYFRNVIKEGKKSKEQVPVYSYESLVWKEVHGDEDYPEWFVTAEDITPMEHLRMQAAAQKWIDSSISKTINIPSDYPFEDFKDIYLNAYDLNLKGCTTFRFNPEAFQGVLVNEKDLDNTTYSFELKDGTLIEAKGNDKIEYDGEVHTAANLFDAIKEGYYGKF